VLALSDKRGPSPVAQTLYEETPESAARRAAQSALRKLAAEPSQERSSRGRPTKRERRDLERWRDA